MRVVRDLPRMSVGVDEHARVASPECLRGSACNRGTGVLGGADHTVDLVARGDVVRERDTSPAAAVGDGAVVRELLASPQREHHVARGEEHHSGLLGSPTSPTELFVERTRVRKIADAESDNG